MNSVISKLSLQRQFNLPHLHERTNSAQRLSTVQRSITSWWSIDRYVQYILSHLIRALFIPEMRNWSRILYNFFLAQIIVWDKLLFNRFIIFFFGFSCLRLECTQLTGWRIMESIWNILQLFWRWIISSIRN